MTRSKLSSVPDWLTGIVVCSFGGASRPQLNCRECSEMLCVIDPGDSLWVLADVARDHRCFYRDKEERLP